MLGRLTRYIAAWSRLSTPHMMRLIVGMMALFPFLSIAQTMDSVGLPPVQIELIKIKRFLHGSKTLKIDSTARTAYQTQSLAELLAHEGAGYFRTAGPGLLSTSSLRGGGAAHTAVLWNGIPLNSSMNGIQDFSLVPVFLFDQIQINYGGGSTQWGSGALGGAVHVGSSLEFKREKEGMLSLGVGSFGAKQIGLSAKHSGVRGGFQVKLFRQEAENDFSFEVPSDLVSNEQQHTQSNAGMTNAGISLDFVLRVKKRQALKFSTWLQHTEREIPTPIGTVYNNGKQEDEARRFLLNYQLQLSKHLLTVRSAWMEEHIDFQNDQNMFRNWAGSSISEVAFKSDWTSNWRTMAEFQQSVLIAVVDSYREQAIEHRTAAYLNVGYHKKRLDLIFSLRQAFVDYRTIPLTYALESRYALGKQAIIRGKGGRVYRLPSLNDKYWSPGGNLSLRPEQGWVAEIGMDLQLLENKRWKLNFRPDFFSRWVQDWIQWVPAGGIWSAENKNQVWSRGLETLTELTAKMGRFQFTMNVGTNYVVSTDSDPLSENYNRQLIYVPLYSGHGRLGIGTKRMQISYQHQYTGYRFLSSDNTSALNPFDLGNVQFNYRFKIWKYELKSFCILHNIWNQNYQLVAQRPMPGRQLNLGITLTQQFL